MTFKTTREVPVAQVTGLTTEITNNVEDSLGSDSKTKALSAAQGAALSARIDALTGGGGTSDALVFKGDWNATQAPPIPDGETPLKGWFYIVSDEGTHSLSGIKHWHVGDWAVRKDDSTWVKIRNYDFAKAGVINQNGATASLNAAVAGQTTVLGSGTKVSVNGSGMKDGDVFYIHVPDSLAKVPEWDKFSNVASFTLLEGDTSEVLSAVDATKDRFLRDTFYQCIVDVANSNVAITAMPILRRKKGRTVVINNDSTELDLAKIGVNAYTRLTASEEKAVKITKDLVKDGDSFTIHNVSTTRTQKLAVGSFVVRDEGVSESNLHPLGTETLTLAPLSILKLVVREIGGDAVLYIQRGYTDSLRTPHENIYVQKTGDPVKRLTKEQVGKDLFLVSFDEKDDTPSSGISPTRLEIRGADFSAGDSFTVTNTHNYQDAVITFNGLQILLAGRPSDDNLPQTEISLKLNESLSFKFIEQLGAKICIVTPLGQAKVLNTLYNNDTMPAGLYPLTQRDIGRVIVTEQDDVDTAKSFQIRGPETPDSEERGPCVADGDVYRIQNNSDREDIYVWFVNIETAYERGKRSGRDFAKNIQGTVPPTLSRMTLPPYSSTKFVVRADKDNPLRHHVDIFNETETLSLKKERPLTNNYNFSSFSTCCNHIREHVEGEGPLQSYTLDAEKMQIGDIFTIENRSNFRGILRTYKFDRYELLDGGDSFIPSDPEKYENFGKSLPIQIEPRCKYEVKVIQKPNDVSSTEKYLVMTKLMGAKHLFDRVGSGTSSELKDHEIVNGAEIFFRQDGDVRKDINHLIGPNIEFTLVNDSKTGKLSVVFQRFDEVYYIDSGDVRNKRTETLVIPTFSRRRFRTFDREGKKILYVYGDIPNPKLVLKLKSNGDDVVPQSTSTSAATETKIQLNGAASDVLVDQGVVTFTNNSFRFHKEGVYRIVLDETLDRDGSSAGWLDYCQPILASTNANAAESVVHTERLKGTMFQAWNNAESSDSNNNGDNGEIRFDRVVRVLQSELSKYFSFNVRYKRGNGGSGSGVKFNYSGRGFFSIEKIA